MLINRDNYETIFLLYVDNELSAQERNAVEAFAKANPDLREELEVLQSTLLPGEEAVFVPKTQLYKHATPVESVQESLLLMLDNELPNKFKKELLQQIDEKEEVKTEWAVLQRTVLNANDVVSFPEKELLYRRTTRVIPMRVWRVAAAVLIGTGIFTGVMLYNDRPSDEVTIAVEKKDKPVKGQDDGPAPLPAMPGEILATGKQTETPTNDVISKPDPIVAKNSKPAHNPKSTIHVDDAKSVAAPVADAMLANQGGGFDKKLVQPRSDNKMAVTESPVTEEMNTIPINDSEVGKVTNTFTRLAVNEDDPDRFLHIEEEKVIRSKLGGIIRQVKRVVERSTKIKPSNGLRIGGFEIAIK